MLVNFSYVVKLANFQIIPIVLPIMSNSMGLEIPALIAVYIDEQMYVDFTMGSDEFKGTIGELLSSEFGEEYNNIPRITKEEFYQVPIDITNATSEELGVIFEDLLSSLSKKYEDGEIFDDPLAMYGYIGLKDFDRMFTRVGGYYTYTSSSLNVIQINFMCEEGDNPTAGWGISKNLNTNTYSKQYPG